MFFKVCCDANTGQSKELSIRAALCESGTKTAVPTQASAIIVRAFRVPIVLRRNGKRKGVAMRCIPENSA